MSGPFYLVGRCRSHLRMGCTFLDHINPRNGQEGASWIASRHGLPEVEKEGPGYSRLPAPSGGYRSGIGRRRVDVARQARVYDASLRDGNLVVIDVMDVIARIRRAHPALDVRSVGPAQTIIEIAIPRRVPSILWVVMIWFLLFVGSGLALMNFHTDVSMKSVHQRIYYLVTGDIRRVP